MSDAVQPWPVATVEGAGPVPQPIVVALVQVLADLQPPRAVPLAVGWSPNEPNDLPMLWIQELGDDVAAGFSMLPGDHERLLEQLGDHLQDLFSEGSSSWGEPHPRCPGHAHPALASLRDGVAWWRCPAEGEWLARVGSFQGT